MNICYWGGTVDVQLGDRVELRAWFRRRTGRVIYVPGISPLNSHYEFNGLRWVAIRSRNMIVGTVVHPSSATLQRKIKFLGRDNSFFEDLPSAEDLEKQGGGWSF